MVESEQVRYYRERAAEYDDAYDGRPPDWQAEMARLRAVFDGCAGLDGEVVELAAGTGQWTARLVARGAQVTAIDAAPEMLAIATERCRGAIVTEVADLLTWQPARTWDAVVACFWLCHVDDDELPTMLAAMADAVRPGGAVFVADKSNQTPNESRTLRDGREYEIADVRRPVSAWQPAFEAVGFDVEVAVTGRRFVAITGVRRS